MIRATCLKCGWHTPFKGSDYFWAVEHEYCGGCAHRNCHSFTNDYTWRNEWKPMVYRFNWWRFRWEKYEHRAM